MDDMVVGQKMKESIREHKEKRRGTTFVKDMIGNCEMEYRC
jgi:hypothetical protein